MAKSPAKSADEHALAGFETQFADMLTRLAAAASNEVDAAVVEAQRRLCELLGTERSSIWQGTPEDPCTLRLTHAYALTDAPKASSEVTANALFPWMMPQLLQGKTLVIPNVSAMPEEAAVDRRNLGFFQAKSSLIIPFRHPSSDIRGVATFASLTHLRSWSEIVISHCRLAVQVMISTLARKRADEAAERERARLRAVLDSASRDLVWCVDAERFTLEIWNRAYAEYLERVTGKVPQIGDSLEDRFRDRTDLLTLWRDMYTRVLRDGPFSTELKFAEGDHSLHLDLHRVMRGGECVSIAVFARDLTSIIDSQKMEALGRLAGGVAHDFNNLLQVMTGVTEMVVAGLGPNDRRTAQLGIVLQAGERAADLTAQLLAFSRQEPRQARVVDLAAIVRDAEKLLRRVLRADIVLALDLGARPAPVLADPGQLHQVIVNLVVNARDAMPSGGRIELALSQTRIAAASSSPFAALPPGDYVELSVRDSGSGIAPAHLQRVFEPFFTTKERGKGTGLGLATVLGVVRQSGGDVRIESKVGVGTRVVVLLPITTAPIDGATQAPSAAPAIGGETILVVEDHSMVRDVLARMLESCGYRVLLAADGEEALALAETHGSHVELVITDVIMPRMSGPELVRALRRKQLNVPVLFTSGFSDVPHDVLEQLAGAPLLRKPYSRASVATAVRAALDAARSDANRSS